MVHHVLKNLKLPVYTITMTPPIFTDVHNYKTRTIINRIHCYSHLTTKLSTPHPTHAKYAIMHPSCIMVLTSCHGWFHASWARECSSTCYVIQKLQVIKIQAHTTIVLNAYILVKQWIVLRWECLSALTVTDFLNKLRNFQLLSDSGLRATASEFVLGLINPYPTAFPYGNGMVLHFYQQQESSTTKTVHKVISKGLTAYV